MTATVFYTRKEDMPSQGEVPNENWSVKEILLWMSTALPEKNLTAAREEVRGMVEHFIFKILPESSILREKLCVTMYWMREVNKHSSREPRPGAHKEFIHDIHHSTGIPEARIRRYLNEENLPESPQAFFADYRAYLFLALAATSQAGICAMNSEMLIEISRTLETLSRLNDAMEAFPLKEASMTSATQYLKAYAEAVTAAQNLLIYTAAWGKVESGLPDNEERKKTRDTRYQKAADAVVDLVSGIVPRGKRPSRVRSRPE